MAGAGDPIDGSLRGSILLCSPESRRSLPLPDPNKIVRPAAEYSEPAGWAGIRARLVAFFDNSGEIPALLREVRYPTWTGTCENLPAPSLGNNSCVWGSVVP